MWFHQIKKAFHISLTLSQYTNKWGTSSSSSQNKHTGISFNFISKKVLLLELIILYTILNCKDCSVVSLEHRYCLRNISGHSSSDIRPSVTDCHFCMPVGFMYLFLMNWLYNIFVAAVTRGVGLSLKLTKGTLTLILTALFLTNWRQFKGRLCLICRALKKWQLMPYISLISLWSKHSPSSRMILYTCVIPFSCLSRQIMGLFWIVEYLFSQIVWLYIMSAVGVLSSCDSDQHGGFLHKTYGPWYRVDLYCTLSKNLDYLFEKSARLWLAIFRLNFVADVLWIRF